MSEQATYRGQPIDEMTREELIAAITVMAKLYQDALDRSRDMASFRLTVKS